MQYCSLVSKIIAELRYAVDSVGRSGHIGLGFESGLSLLLYLNSAFIFLPWASYMYLTYALSPTKGVNV